MKKNKILVLVLSCFFVFSLCGCNQDGVTIDEQESILEIEQVEEESTINSDLNQELTDDSNIETVIEDNNTKIEEIVEKYEEKDNLYLGLVVDIPDNVIDLVTIETSGEGDTEHVRTLISVSETKSIEAGEKVHPGEDWGDGWLFGILELDQEGYEEWSTYDPTGFRFFAKSDDKYYIYTHPTDVRLMREEQEDYQDAFGEWGMLCEWANTIPEQFVKDNTLENFSVEYNFEF